MMLKAPLPGTVKTRLAASIGVAAATDVYRGLVEHQAAQVPLEWCVEVHFTPVEAEAQMRDWLAPLLPEQTVFLPQAEGDLGARLRAALAGVVLRGAKQVLFIGADCPQLTVERLREAAVLLLAADFVLSPATDGGYVLIGLADNHDFIFKGITWSTSAVCEQTKRNIQRRGMSLQLLESLDDVDDLPSLLQTCQRCPAIKSRQSSSLQTGAFL